MGSSKADKKSNKGVIGLAVAAILIVICCLVPSPEGMQEKGMASIGLFLAAIVLWVTEAVPLSIAAIGLIGLIPLLGIMDLPTALSSFGVTTVLFMMAAFGITIALSHSSIPLRVTAWIVKATKGKSRWIIFGFCMACGLFSSIMSNLATCALFFGFAAVILKASNQIPGKSNFGKALMICLPVCTGVGGLIMPPGTSGNVLLMEILEGYGIHMTFAQWCAIGAPLGIITMLITAFWLPIVFKMEDISSEAQELLDRQVKEAGKLTPYEIKALIIIALMLVCWFLGSFVKVLSTPVVAVLGLFVMFLPGVKVLEWKIYTHECNWNLILICGSATVIMSTITATGAMEWIVTKLFANIGSLPTVLMWIVIALVICVFRTPIPTATAVTVLFVPMLYSIAQLTGSNVTGMLMIPAYWGPGAMLLLYTEPLFLITFSEGYYTEGDLLKFGVLPSVIMAVLMGVTFPWYMPLLGLA